MPYLDENYDMIQPDPSADPINGGKLIFKNGVEVSLISTLGFILYPSLLGVVFTVIGAVCGVFLMSKTRECRRIVIAYYIMCAIPLTVSVTVNVIRELIHLSNYEVTSLGGFIWLFSKIDSYFELGIVGAGFLAAMGFWIKYQISLYIDIFEDRDVAAYINGEDNDLYM